MEVMFFSKLVNLETKRLLHGFVLYNIVKNTVKKQQNCKKITFFVKNSKFNGNLVR